VSRELRTFLTDSYVLNGSDALKDHQEGVDYALLTTVHTRLTQLHTIVFRTTCDQYTPTFAECTFPRLSHFVSDLSITTDLVEFLNRHPMIQHLQLFDKRDVYPIHQPLPQFPSICLPNLTKFFGPAYIVPSIFPMSSKVDKLAVRWGEQFSHDSDIIPVVDSLSRMRPPLMEISCFRHDWGIQLLDSISHYLPDVLSVAIFSLVPAVHGTLEGEKVRVCDTCLICIPCFMLTFTL
jgi:hypothetical protein